MLKVCFVLAPGGAGDPPHAAGTREGGTRPEPPGAGACCAVTEPCPVRQDCLLLSPGTRPVAQACCWHRGCPLGHASPQNAEARAEKRRACPEFLHSCVRRQDRWGPHRADRWHSRTGCLWP